MKTVKCKSGLTGWQSKLQKVYNSFSEFEQYCELYDIHSRLGFKTAKEAWDINPMIQGSTNPDDLRVVKTKKKVFNYYAEQLKRINPKSEYAPGIKISDGEGPNKTNWMRLNKESAAELIN